TNSGGRYNPSTDTWLSTGLGTGVPTPRLGHSAVWTNGKMIIWGGLDASALNNGAAYTPSSNSWAPITTTGAPAARYHHSAVWTGSEMIVWGGTGSTGGSLATGGRYKPSTNSWTAVSTGANTPAARASHTAIWTGSQMVIWGGGLASGGRYSPASNSW